MRPSPVGRVAVLHLVLSGLSLSFAIVILSGFSGCGGGGGNGGGGGGNPPPTASISANPTTITAGQSSTLTWSSTNASSCEASGAWTGSELTIGTQSVSPTTTSAYTLTCTGQGGTSSPASVTVTVNPATSTVTSVTVTAASSAITAGGTDQLTATVNGTNNPSQAVTWSVASGPGTVSASGLYTAPSSVASATNVTITATSTQDTTKSGSAEVTVNPAVSAPTVSLSPSTATVALGSTQNYTISVSDATAALSCSVPVGSCSISGTTVTYTPGTAVPSAWTGSVSVTAKNAGGSGTGSASFVLAPSVTSVIVSDANGNAFGTTFFCARDLNPACTLFESITGNGFCNGCVLHNSRYQDITLPYTNDPPQISTESFVDTPHYSPGIDFISVSAPSGSGGGTSNSVAVNFIGGQNTLAMTSTEAYALDQADANSPDQTGNPAAAVYKFKLNGTEDGSFPVARATVSGTTYGYMAYGIATDGTTGNLVTTVPFGGFLYNASGTQVGENDTISTSNQFPYDVAAQGGYAVVSQDQENQISMLDLSQTNPSFVPTAVAGTPFNVQMAQVGGKLSAVVLTIGTPGISLVNVPSGTLAGAVNLANLTSSGMTSSQTFYQGGWDLAVFASGSASGTAVALFRADKTVVFVNLSTMAETRRVKLSGDPFRIAVDPTHGAVIVGLVNPNGGTEFVSVNAGTGAVTNLKNTSSLLASGLAVSSDGTKLYVAMRNQFQVVTNN